jgi:hypothetical protein
VNRKKQRFALAFVLTFAVTAVTVLPGSVVTASPAEAGIFSVFGGGKKKSKRFNPAALFGGGLGGGLGGKGSAPKSFANKSFANKSLAKKRGPGGPGGPAGMMAAMGPH